MSTGERIYVQELTEKIKHLESERQELIDALMKAVEWDSHDDTGYPAVWFEQAKQALRNAGMEDL